MFLSQLQFELNDFVIRDFKEIGQIDSPVYAEHGGEKSEYLVVLYNEETDSFWTLGMGSFQKGKFEKAKKIDQIGAYWDLIRSTYRSEQKSLVYRRIGAKAYVFNLDRFHAKHPYTASKIILWDSEQMDHLLMKYDRDVVETSFAIHSLNYPQIEKLYKAGFESIILNWVLRDNYPPSLVAQFEKCFRNAGNVKQITSLTKGQWSQLLNFKLDLSEWLWIMQILTGCHVTDANVTPLVKMMIRGGERFRKSFEKITQCTADGQTAYDADQLIRDLRNDHGKTGMDPQQACIYLWDYIRLCQRNKVEPDYRTENLRDEHDMMEIMQREKKEAGNDEKTMKVYADRYDQLAVYLFESEELTVVLPQKRSDLIYEGRNNHNCVGSLYVSRYEKGTSQIFFIRRKSQPEESYITVELNKACDQTIQAFYSYNRKITEKRDLEFIAAWLKNNRRVNRTVKSGNGLFTLTDDLL